MKKNNKVYVILIIFLIVFFFLIYFLVGKKEIEKENEEVTLLLGENTIWQYKYKNWNVISNDLEQYNWEKFQIFLDGQYEDELYIWHSDKWYIFDDNKEAINYTSNFLALKANFDINVKKFVSSEITNLSKISDYLSSKNISAYSELTVKTETQVDIDNDGSLEEIYIISNVFPIDSTPNEIFAYVFMKKNNQIYEIFNFEEQNSVDNGVKPYINSIIDVDNDGMYEIILSCAGYSIEEPENYLYKFTNNKFEKLI